MNMRVLLAAAGSAALVLALFAARPPRPAEPETPPAARLSFAQYPLGESAQRGATVYARWCVGCHGPEGRGDGIASPLLSPPPRNFQLGKFKFRSTPSGELPTEADLLHTISCGLQGSAMPGFPLMPEPEKRDVVAFVRALTEYGLVKREVDYVMEDEELSLEQVLGERFAEIREEALADAYENVWPVAVPPEPEVDGAALAQGRKLYEQQCVACHGSSGRGDGPSNNHLRDGTDAPIRARDFTTGVFRAGSAPSDLFLRMKTGLNGTPMPAVSGSDDDLWAIAHYILSLRDPANAGFIHPTSCEAHAHTTVAAQSGAPAGAQAGEVAAPDTAPATQGAAK